MQIFELRFRGKADSAEPFGKNFSALLDVFLCQCVKCGLILDGNVQTYHEADKYVCRVIALDQDAISEQNMSYDAAEALSALIQTCGGLPQLIPCEELANHPSCTCEKSSYYLLDGCAPWEGTGVLCGDCQASVPLYRLYPRAVNLDFSELQKWCRLYNSVKTQYLSGYNSASAYNALNSCISNLNLMGRSIAGSIERLSDIITLYPLFSRFENISDKCPQCGGSWVNQYRDAVPYERYCRACRIVM